MGSPLPPDPYQALGVEKHATAASIKAVYRKLVLKCHPDKIQDEGLKEAAADQFHKIQTAYEIIGDEARRARYDAQIKLAELRRDVMESRGPRGDVRTSKPTESSRGGSYFDARPHERPARTPQYEERRPNYAQYDDYEMPRSTPRRDHEHERERERTPKRASPREDRERSKTAAKENERSTRKEKSRRTEKDVRRDRDRKAANFVTVEDYTSSDSDGYERMRRRQDYEELQRAKEAYHESERRQREQAEMGHFSDLRAEKMFSQGADARAHMDNMRSNQSRRSEEPERRPTSERRPESDRRPEPPRNLSSKDKIPNMKREGSEKLFFRRGSGERPRDEDGRRPSRDRDPIEIVEEPEDLEREPPSLQTMKSAPPVINVLPPNVRPSMGERQRSHSVQEKQEDMPKPQFKRSDSTPITPSEPSRPRNSRRQESSKLRSEVKNAYPTPEASPEPQPMFQKVNYGYADDNEYATPDGYRTELREPVPRERERQRSTSKTTSKPPSMPRTTSYKYTPDIGVEPVMRETRPSLNREDSGRLYGELPTTSRSPRQSTSKFPAPESVRYAPEPKLDQTKIQTGYKSRPSKERAYMRSHRPTASVSS